MQQPTTADASPVVEAWTTYRTGDAAQWTPSQLAEAKNGDREVLANGALTHVQLRFFRFPASPGS